MKKLLMVLSLFLLNTASFAEVVVIVHPSNTSELTKLQIAQLYLSKEKSFPNGQRAIALTQPQRVSTTKYFYRHVLERSPSQLRSYWSKLLFTGKGTPPREINTDREMVELVTKNPNFIGFVSEQANTASVKIAGHF